MIFLFFVVCFCVLYFISLCFFLLINASGSDSPKYIKSLKALRIRHLRGTRRTFPLRNHGGSLSRSADYCSCPFSVPHADPFGLLPGAVAAVTAISIAPPRH